MNDVNVFLTRFHESEDINTVFTEGCCFWFALILYIRFSKYNAEIVHDRVFNHFGTRILGRVYDITGDITEKYTWEVWRDIEDELEANRIIRDCIMF